MNYSGKDSDTATGHVFHVNISLPEATQCNDAQCAFFKAMLRKEKRNNG